MNKYNPETKKEALELLSKGVTVAEVSVRTGYAKGYVQTLKYQYYPTYKKSPKSAPLLNNSNVSTSEFKLSTIGFIANNNKLANADKLAVIRDIVA